MAILGAALGHTVLTMVAAAGLTALLMGFLAVLVVPNLQVDRNVEPRATQRGLPARGVLTVENSHGRPTPACSAVDIVAGAEIPVAVPALRPGHSVTVDYTIPTQRRGQLDVGPLAITRHDPLSLWQTRRRVGKATTLVVHPRIHAIEPRPAGRSHHIEGPTSESAPRGTLVFHSLREYTPGDDIRRIHWRTSARTGTLMTREHVDTSLPSTVVVLDTRSECYDLELFEDAVDVAASVVASSEERGFPIQLISAHSETHTVRAGQRAGALHSFLMSVRDRPDGDLRTAMVRVRQRRDHDAIVVVSGGTTEADLAVVTSMTSGFRTPVLATVSTTIGPRWSSGAHLQGASAAEVLGRWAVETP